MVDPDEVLARTIDLATGHSLDEVEAVLERTPRLVRIAEGVARLRKRGSRVALLSLNPPYVVEWYRRNLGFDGAQAVPFRSVENGRIGPPVSVPADKVAGLRALLSRGSLEASTVVHVGDGPADAEVFRAVGGGIAVNSDSADVVEAADRAVVTTDLCEVVEAITEPYRDR